MTIAVVEERIFQAVVYAFEGRDVPLDTLTHGMVKRALAYREKQTMMFDSIAEQLGIETFRALQLEAELARVKEMLARLYVERGLT
jgi:hypothetical protein